MIRLASSATLLSVFLLIVSSCAHKFNFNSEGEFTVLQFTDFHFGESEEGDSNTVKLQRDMIAKVKPDLIVISGDGVSGYAGWQDNGLPKPGFFEKHWKMFLEPVSEAGIPYAFTFGNHDAEADMNRVQISRLDMTHPLSVRNTSEGIPDSLNFYIPVNSGKAEDKLALNIWLFDTGSIGCMNHSDSWGCIEEHQIQWYEQESTKIKEQHGSDIHHIAFLHIPIPEYMMLVDNSETYGFQKEAVSCPNSNSGFFDRVKAVNEISAMFVGHDHTNNYGGWYQGIELVYGQKSGYGSYGTVRGVRVLNFKENVDANGKVSVQRDHYIIYENGKIDKTKKTHTKDGEKQMQCPTLHFGPPPEKPPGMGFFEYVLLSCAILFALVAFCVFRIIKSSSKGKQHHVFNEISNPTEDEAPQEDKSHSDMPAGKKKSYEDDEEQI